MLLRSRLVDNLPTHQLLLRTALLLQRKVKHSCTRG
jgi:hypothetical protein